MIGTFKYYIPQPSYRITEYIQVDIYVRQKAFLYPLEHAHFYSRQLAKNVIRDRAQQDINQI